MDVFDAPIIQRSVVQTGILVRSLQKPLQPLQSHGSPRFLIRITATVRQPLCINALIVAVSVATVAATSLQRPLQPLQEVRKCARHQRKVLQRLIVEREVLFPRVYKNIPGVATGHDESGAPVAVHARRQARRRMQVADLALPGALAAAGTCHKNKTARERRAFKGVGGHEISTGLDCRPTVFPFGTPPRNWDYFSPCDEKR